MFKDIASKCSLANNLSSQYFTAVNAHAVFATSCGVNSLSRRSATFARQRGREGQSQGTELAPVGLEAWWLGERWGTHRGSRCPPDGNEAWRLAGLEACRPHRPLREQVFLEDQGHPAARHREATRNREGSGQEPPAREKKCAQNEPAIRGHFSRDGAVTESLCLHVPKLHNVFQPVPQQLYCNSARHLQLLFSTTPQQPHRGPTEAPREGLKVRN